VPFVELAANSEPCSRELNSDIRIAVYLFISMIQRCDLACRLGHDATLSGRR
jgi:hypothetical protein